jgi:hypothetical protein
MNFLNVLVKVVSTSEYETLLMFFLLSYTNKLINEDVGTLSACLCICVCVCVCVCMCMLIIS